MNDLLQKWLDAASAYVNAPFALAAGEVSVLSVVPTVGIVCLIAGIVLSAVRRERQALWTIPVIVIAALSPLLLRLANTVAGWFGMTFAVFVGAIFLLVWIGLIANEATYRLPVWLLGLFALSLGVLGTAYGFLVLTGV